MSTITVVVDGLLAANSEGRPSRRRVCAAFTFDPDGCPFEICLTLERNPALTWCSDRLILKAALVAPGHPFGAHLVRFVTQYGSRWVTVRLQRFGSDEAVLLTVPRLPLAQFVADVDQALDPDVAAADVDGVLHGLGLAP